MLVCRLMHERQEEWNGKFADGADHATQIRFNKLLVQALTPELRKARLTDLLEDTDLARKPNQAILIAQQLSTSKRSQDTLVDDPPQDGIETIKWYTKLELAGWLNATKISLHDAEAVARLPSISTARRT